MPKVPNPEAMARIAALNAELDSLAGRLARAERDAAYLRECRRILREKRALIYLTCERVET